MDTYIRLSKPVFVNCCREVGVEALHLPAGDLKIRFEFELVPKREPSRYQPTDCSLGHSEIGVGTSRLSAQGSV